MSRNAAKSAGERGGRKRGMEHNTVILSLDTYEAMKDKIETLRKKVAEQEEKFKNLKIFECREIYGGGLSLDFAEDAKQFVDKAFEPFKETHIANELNNYAMFSFAKKMPSEPEEKE
jgi:hypothetical protein